MIDLANEKVFPISQGYVGPKRRGGGNRVHGKTLRNWGLVGLPAPDGSWVYLDLIQFGKTPCTSVEAVQRFCERLTPSPAAPKHASTPARRSRADEQAAKQCERLGL